jgi:pimeloyl-ACP methyl ester carboxylesterase
MPTRWSDNVRVTVDDAQIDVEDRGSGDAIVLLHGFPLTRAIWDAQVDALSRSHRVFCPDLRGMGASSSPDGPYLMETLASDIAGMLDAMSVERATIVGHSLGGYVALAFARMYVERVAGLALVCSRIAADSPEQARAREDLAVVIERKNSIQPAIEAYVPKLFAPETPALRPDLVERVCEIARCNDPLGAAAMLRGMAQRIPADDIVGDVEGEVLVIAGGADRLFGRTEARQVTDAFRSGRLEFCEASGHLPMLEEPDRVSALLLGWLG